MLKIDSFAHQELGDLGEGARPIIEVVLWWVVTECNSRKHKVWPRHDLVAIIILFKKNLEGFQLDSSKLSANGHQTTNLTPMMCTYR